MGSVESQDLHQQHHPILRSRSEFHSNNLYTDNGMEGICMNESSAVNDDYCLVQVNADLCKL